jgi:hypothetical protein
MSSPIPDNVRQQRTAASQANSQWVAAWESLLERQPHLRHPEAAALALRIPEAGMMALRNGQDTTRLRGRLSEWLAPVAAWGPVAVTVRNRLGAATVRTEIRSLTLTGDTVSLRGDQVQVLISSNAALHAFLHEDPTSPGSAHGLHVYDPAGEVLLRIQLLSAAGERAALPHLLAHADYDSGTGWRAGSIGGEAVSGFPGWCSIVSTLNRMEAARRAMVAAVASCDTMPQLRLVLESKAVALTYLGPVHGTLNAVPAAGQAACVLSARATTANHAFICLSPDNVPYLRFHDAESGTLTLWPQLPASEARAWVDAAASPPR